jgi:hypothetical protein
MMPSPASAWKAHLGIPQQNMFKESTSSNS